MDFIPYVFAAQVRAAYKQEQDMVTAPTVMTDRRDEATLGLECQWEGKEEERVGPGLLILYRKKKSSWGTISLEAFEQGVYGSRFHSGGQTQPL